MLLLIILLIITFSLIGISYVISGKDVFSPNVLFYAGFALAFIAALMNVSKWGINLGVETFMVLLVGLFSFLFGNVFKKTNTRINVDTSKRKIVIPFYKTLVVVFISLIGFYFYYKDIVRIAQTADPYWQAQGLMVAYKQALTYGGESISSISNYLSKTIYCFGYIYIFVFFNNFCYGMKKMKIREYICYLLPVVMFVIMSILKGNRIDIISLIIAGVFFYYYWWKMYRDWGKIKNNVIFRKVLVLFCVGIFLFYSLKSIFGRSSSLNFFDYVTQYIGGSIKLLDMYIKGGVRSSNAFLGETFTGLITGLHKIGLTSVSISKQLEFRTTETGVYLGNVYTSFRRFYNDLGFFGVFFFTFILSIFFNTYYYSIRGKKCDCYSDYLKVIIYGSLLYCIPLQAMEDSFYINKITIGYFTELVILAICLYFVFPFKRKGGSVLDENIYSDVGI